MYLTLTPAPNSVERKLEKSPLDPEIDLVLKCGPSPEPISLFPGGVPILVYPFPLGTME